MAGPELLVRLLLSLNPQNDETIEVEGFPSLQIKKKQVNRWDNP
jgi:hypothetical protein